MTELFDDIAIQTRTPYQVRTFDRVTAFDAFVDAQITQLSSPNQKTWNHLVIETDLELQKGTDWYGDPAPGSVRELDDHRTFSGMALLKQVQPKIKEHLRSFLDHLAAHVLPEPKVEYNDRGLGLFSFDRAAMGLYRLPRIDLHPPMASLNSQLRIELQQHPVTTSVKKVYAYFQHREVQRPSLRLYLMAGGNAHVAGNALLYTGLACAELVAFLERRAVPVEINVLYGNAYDGRHHLAVVRVKRFQDTLDVNQLLLMSSDPRYFRFRGFKALIALADAFGQTIPTHLGRLEPDMGKHYVQTLPAEQQGIVFEQSYSLEAAAREVKRIVEALKNAQHPLPNTQYPIPST